MIKYNFCDPTKFIGKTLKMIPKLVPKLKKESEKLLKEALTANFDSVIIFGFFSENQTTKTTWSNAINRLELIGALEAAKQHIFNNK